LRFFCFFIENIYVFEGYVANYYSICKKKIWILNYIIVNFYRFYSFVRYFFTARHAKGYGIHSPFVFNLVREVIYQKHHFYSFNRIALIRDCFLNNHHLIKRNDFGAGSAKSSFKTTIAEVARRSSVKQKYGQLLTRLTAHFKPQIIIELGTSLGISTLYMALVNRTAVVCTIEGDKVLHEHAQAVFSNLGLNNVKAINGNFDELLEPVLDNCQRIDMAFIDGNHKGEATIGYFNSLMQKTHNYSMLIFDDIHWSADMYRAWQQICSHPKVTVSLDLYQFGIVFFRKECQKQHFVVRY
jgi:predicted O-methyltransferase YrrM